MLPYFSTGGMEISSSMLHYFFVVVQFNEAEMECAHFAAVDEAHVHCIVFKVAAQANTLPGDEFAG